MALLLALAAGGCEPPGEDAVAASPGDAEPVEPTTALRVEGVHAQPDRSGFAVVVELSRPVAPTTEPSRWLRLTADDGTSVDGGWVLDAQGRRLRFAGLRPDRRYRVRVEPGLPAAVGPPLADAVSEQVETGSAPAAVGFASRGNLLPAEPATGLPVMAVNVEAVDVDFYRVRPDEALRFLRRFGRDDQLAAWQAESVLATTDLVFSGRFDLDAPSDQRVTRRLPVRDLSALDPPGIYLAVMRRPGAVSGRYPATWFAVTDLGVQVRRYEDALTFRSRSLATAQPTGGVRIRLLGEDGTVVAETATDAAGRARLPVTWPPEEAPGLLVARSGPHTSVVRLFGPALDLSAFDLGGPTQRPTELFLYGPRDLYRPGETVTVAGLLRDGDGRMVPMVPLRFQLVQPDGRKVATRRVEGSDLGHYAAAFDLAAGAPTGRWRVAVDLPGGGRVERAVQVEAFVPEQMALELSGPDRVRATDPASVRLVGRYLYGAPAADHRVRPRLLLEPRRRPFASRPDTVFGVPATDLDRVLELEPVVLGGDGAATLTLPKPWKDLATPLRLELVASLLEASGRAVTRSFEALVLPDGPLLGVRPLFGDRRVAENSSAAFELLATADGESLLDAEVTLRLVREHRDEHWVYDDHRGWRVEHTERDELVVERSLDLRAEGPVEVDLPVANGGYRLELHHAPSGGRTSYRFRAGWPGQEVAARPDRVVLGLDRPVYRAGDEVTLTVRPPAAGRGVLLVEGDGPLHAEPLALPAEGGEVSFRLGDWARHDLYVSVYLVQPGEARAAGLPRRMLGITHLPLDRAHRTLELAIEAPESVRPRSDVEVVLRSAATAAATPADLAVTLAAVDQGVLGITGFETPAPAEHFFGKRRYGIDLHDTYADLVEGGDGVPATLRWGGGSGLERAGAAARADVRVVSTTVGPVRFGADGVARLPLTIPDFDGRLRLMAVGFGRASFGHAEREMTVVSPVVARLAMPRFLAGGDESRLQLRLDNRTERPQTLAVELLPGTGLEAVDGAALRRSVDLAPGASRTLDLPVRAARRTGTAPLELHVGGIRTDAGTERLQRERSLALRPAWPAVTQRWRRVLATAETFSPPADAFAGLLPATLTGRLTLATRPPLDVAAQVRALETFPYACLEQTVSAGWPDLLLDPDWVGELELDSTSSPEDREEDLLAAVQTILGMQRPGGGFGLWGRGHGGEEYWLTVYATDFLLQVAAAGLPVPDEPLTAAVERLEHYLGWQRPMAPGYAEDPAAATIAVKAYAALVLARSNRAPLGVLRTLWDERGEAAPPLAAIQLGLALLSQGDPRRGEAALARGLAGTSSEAFAAAPFGSPLRDRALAIHQLLEHRAAAVDLQRLEPLLLALDDDLASRRWRSTQERAALFLAGASLRALPQGEELRAALRLEGGRDVETVARETSERGLDAADLAGLAVRNTGSGPLFLSLLANGYGAEPPAPMDRGVSVERFVYDTDGDPRELDRLATGELVLVELRVQSEGETRLPHLLVVDLLPAGLELENQNLERASVALDAIRLEGRPVAALVSGHVVHQEYRDDRYVAQLDLGGSGAARLFYLARAVTPGRYQIPPTFAEDLYRPEHRHLGKDPGELEVMPR